MRKLIVLTTMALVVTLVAMQRVESSECCEKTGAQALAKSQEAEIQKLSSTSIILDAEDRLEELETTHGDLNARLNALIENGFTEWADIGEMLDDALDDLSGPFSGASSHIGNAREFMDDGHAHMEDGLGNFNEGNFCAAWSDYETARGLFIAAKDQIPFATGKMNQAEASLESAEEAIALEEAGT